MKRPGYSRYLWILVCAVAILAAAAVVLIISAAQFSSSNTEHKALTSLSVTGEYSINGGAWQSYNGGCPSDMQDASTVTIRGTLSSEIPVNTEVLFYIRNLFVTCKVNDTIVYNFGLKGSYPEVFRSPGITWGHFDSDGIPSGSRFEITMTNPYKNTTGGYYYLMSSLSYGHYSQLYEQMFTTNRVSIIVAYLVIFLGIFALLISVTAGLCHMPQAKKAAMLSVFTIVGGFWILFDMSSQAFPLLIGSPVLSSVYNILVLYIIAPSCLLVFSEYTNGRIQTVIRCLTAGLFSFVGLLIILQLSGTIQLYEQQELMLNTNYAILTVVMILTGVDALRYNNRSARYLIISLLPCTVAAIYESLTQSSNNSVPANIVFSSGLLITILLLLIELIFFVQQSALVWKRTLELQKELEKNRISAMISQIQPHFIYNVLNAISGLCSTDPEQADNAIITFSKYLRNNIDSLESSSPITFYEEKRHIRQYVELEQLRFGDKIHIEYDIHYSDFMLPPLTLQPLIENAVKHGISVKPDGGTVVIRTIQDHKDVIIMVIDDGVGFDMKEYRSRNAQQHERNSIGLHNVESRLSYISGAKMKVESEPGKGTTVTIRLPIMIPSKVIPVPETEADIPNE